MDAFLLSIITPDFENFYSLQSQTNSNPRVFLPLTLSTFTHSRVKSTQTPVTKIPITYVFFCI